jgi:uncharacterized protein
MFAIWARGSELERFEKMKTHWFENRIDYDGSQLRSLFTYVTAGILGDSIVAWRGACNIPLDKMVDGEDFRAQEKICGSDMIHFIVEKFPGHLGYAVSLQRLLASIVKDFLEQKSPSFRGQLIREGDDIYIEGSPRRKLSISIATVSPVSLLIHFAVNVSNKGTPVPTCSLEDLGVDPNDFARSVLERFSNEANGIEQATQKVFSVK